MHREVTNNFKKLRTMSSEIDNTPEIDNNIFKAVTLTTGFLNVVFRLVEYLL